MIERSPIARAAWRLANVLVRIQGKNQRLVAATDLDVSLTAELKSANASHAGITP